MRRLALLGALALIAVERAAARPSQGIEDRLTSQNATTRNAALAEALAKPEAIHPFDYAYISGTLWQRGDRLQAAFWFYVWQIRSRPWADADPDPSSAPALRASIGSALGQPINEWLGSDLAAWKDVALRAMSYEARLPLFSEHPEGVDAARWRAIVASARVAYRKGFDQALGNVDASEFAATRRANGLYVGPLRKPGAALPDSWR